MKSFIKALMSGGKPKTTGTEVISNVGIAKNIDTKRNIQDNVVSAVDSAFKKADVPPSLRNQQKKSKLKKDESKKLKDVSYKLDKLEEKVKKRNEGSSKLIKAFKGRKFNKGGRVGLKRGTNLISKKKSNIQKIQETFGPGKSNPKKSAAKKKKFPDLTGDGKVTFADILKGRGVKRG